MFAMVAFGDGGEVVGWGQPPTALAADEAEVFGVVVLVVGKDVEGHPAEHGFHLARVLGEVACEVQQGLVVQFRVVDGLVEQGAGGGHMEAFAMVEVEASRGKIFAFKKFEVWYFYSATAGEFVVFVFQQPQVFRVVGVAELHQPAYNKGILLYL